MFFERNTLSRSAQSTRATNLVMNHQHIKTSKMPTSKKSTSILVTLSTYIGLTNYAILVLSILYLFYMVTKPCQIGDRCEAIPFFELLFVVTACLSIMNLLQAFLHFSPPQTRS